MRKEDVTIEHATLGWSDCGHDDYRPGMVLDCFGGTGTTGLVAHGHGRDAILIDIDSRNAELARDRIGPLFLEIIGLDDSEEQQPASSQSLDDGTGTE